MEPPHTHDCLPQEPGWYWLKRRFSEELELCEVLRVGPELMVRQAEGAEVRPIWLMSGSWVGPLALEGRKVVLF